MKQSFCRIIFTALFCSSIGVFAAIVPKEMLRLEDLPSCPATRISPSDMPADPTPGIMRKLPRYYTSQLIGLKPDKEPPYESLKELSQSSDPDIIDFMKMMVQLYDDKDLCDQVGLIYAARFHHYFCQDGEHYKTLNPSVKNAIRAILLWSGEFMDRANLISGCKA